MRERMAKPAAVAADAPRNAAAPSTARAATGTTDVVLSAIFGNPPSERERDVDDEMDALFGKRR